MLYSVAAKATVVAYDVAERAPAALLAKPSDVVDPSPNWKAFTEAGSMANKVLGFGMALALCVCVGMIVGGVAKQRLGSPQGGRSSYSSEEGKGLLISGIVGVIVLAIAMPLLDAAWVLPGV